MVSVSDIYDFKYNTYLTFIAKNIRLKNTTTYMIKGSASVS